MDGRNKDWYFRMEHAKYKAALTAWIVTMIVLFCMIFVFEKTTIWYMAQLCVVSENTSSIAQENMELMKDLEYYKEYVQKLEKQLDE